jgi:hypothetical protein
MQVTSMQTISPSLYPPLQGIEGNQVSSYQENINTSLPLSSLRAFKVTRSAGHQPECLYFTVTASSGHSRSPGQKVYRRLFVLSCLRLLKAFEITRSAESSNFTLSVASLYSRSPYQEVNSRLFFTSLHQPPKGIQGQQVISRTTASRCIRLHINYPALQFRGTDPLMDMILSHTYNCHMSFIKKISLVFIH